MTAVPAVRAGLADGAPDTQASDLELARARLERYVGRLAETTDCFGPNERELSGPPADERDGPAEQRVEGIGIVDQEHPRRDPTENRTIA